MIERRNQLEAHDHEGFVSFTPDHAAHLLFLSYRHSQGLIDLQQFFYRHLHHIRPDLVITDEFVQQTTPLITDRVLRYVTRSGDPFQEHSTDEKAYHRQFSTAYLQKDAALRTRQMQSELNAEAADPERMPELLGKIATDMIRSDFQFFDNQNEEFKGNGRLRKNMNPQTNVGDPWFSQIVHYALRGNPTGAKEYDLLFTDVNRFLRDPDLTQSFSRQTDSQFSQIIEIYNAHHPDTAFTW